MSVDREAIYLALFARFAGLTFFVKKSRILKGWYDTPAEEQPALYMAQTDQGVTSRTNLPTRYMLNADLYLYAKVPDGTAPGTILNQMLALIDDALAADEPFDGRCTLGGLVHYARVNGTVETDEGTLGDQAVAIVPIEILINNS